MGRSNVITFKASTKERQTLEVIASRENRTVSEMLRELIREGAAKRGLYAVGMVQLLSKYEVDEGGNHDNKTK